MKTTSIQRNLMITRYTGSKNWWLPYISRSKKLESLEQTTEQANARIKEQNKHDFQMKISRLNLWNQCLQCSYYIVAVRYFYGRKQDYKEKSITFCMSLTNSYLYHKVLTPDEFKPSPHKGYWVSYVNYYYLCYATGWCNESYLSWRISRGWK